MNINIFFFLVDKIIHSKSTWTWHRITHWHILTTGKAKTFALKFSLKILETRPQTQQTQNICTTSAQSLWCWSNIVKMLCNCFVFTGNPRRPSSSAHGSTTPVNTTHFYNICTMLDQRRSLGPALYKCYTKALCLLGLICAHFAPDLGHEKFFTFDMKSQ